MPRRPKPLPELVEDEFTTHAMRLAHKQRWTLPEGTKAELEAALAALPDPPGVEHFLAELPPGQDDEARVKEAKRLARNAQVNTWRARGRLQAAIDTRSAGAKRVRAKGKSKAA